MYIPSARERVNLTGREDVFLVVFVDQDGQSADLIPLSGAVYLLEGVAFSELSPLGENIPPGAE